MSAAYSRTLGAKVKEAAIVWPYTSFGKPSAVVSKTVDAKLGTTTVRFANGTRLLVKPTKFEKDKIQVSVSFGNGRAGVKPELAHSLWEAQLYPFAGTAKLSLGDVTKWAETTGKVASIGFEAGMRSFVLKGATRPADLTDPDADARSLCSRSGLPPGGGRESQVHRSDDRRADRRQCRRRLFPRRAGSDGRQ